MHLLVEMSVKCRSSTTHFNSLTEVVYLYAPHTHTHHNRMFVRANGSFTSVSTRLFVSGRRLGKSATRGRSWAVLGGSTGYGEGCLDSRVVLVMTAALVRFPAQHDSRFLLPEHGRSRESHLPAVSASPSPRSQGATLPFCLPDSTRMIRRIC